MEQSLTEEKFRSKYGYSPKKVKSSYEKLQEIAQCNSSCLKKKALGFMPILSWLPRYHPRKYLVGDVVSGLTTSVVRIPQGLAYGLLAGLEPINGLYTGFFSSFVYMIFGTSRHISVGVFSIVSLMLGSAVDKQRMNADAPPSVAISTTESPENATNILYNTTGANDIDMTSADPQNLAIVCSLTVLIGFILLLLGLFKLGIVAMFLSDPLVSSFTTAAAIYVVTAQLKYVTGIPLQRQNGILGLVKTYVELFSNIGEIQWAAVILSLVCLVILVPIKYVNRTYKEKLHNIPIPVELFIVVLGTVISGVADFNKQYNIKVVGPVPSGMPSPVLPRPFLWPQLIGDAVSIAVVIFAVAISMGKIFAKRHGYKIDPNQELIALGLCQITSGIFRGHSGGGALARSSVQESSGGNTQIAALVSCLILLLVLLVIGPLFENLPLACLACIILANLHGLLMQFQALPTLWRLDVYDFSVWVFTFISVMLLGVDLGLGAGVVFSLCCGGVRSSRTKIKFLCEVDGTGQFRDSNLYDTGTLIQIPGIKIVQFSESITYANKSVLLKITPELFRNEASHRKKVVENHDGEADDPNDNVQMKLTDPLTRNLTTHIVIFDCSGWNVIDSVGMSTLKFVLSDLAAANIKVLLASVQHDVYQKLKLCGIVIGDDDGCDVKVYPSLSDAVKVARSILPNLENHPASSDI